MPKVMVLTDSTAYIPPELSAGLPIITIPLHIHWGSEHFLDAIDITPAEFYRRLATSDIMPTTSQATPEDFKSVFERLLSQGYHVLGIFLSSKLTATIYSAIQASTGFPEGTIELMDSLTGAMATGFQVLVAARAAAQGAVLAECRSLAERARQNTDILFAVGTLEFLRRGGRIGAATALLGTVLQFKPILTVKDGIIAPLERVRTMKNAVERLIELMETRIAGRTPIHLAVMHSNLPDAARDLLERIRQRLGENKIAEGVISDISPAIGTHIGPGAVGVAYLAGM
jgi:DegV family protein with EDD domain